MALKRTEDAPISIEDAIADIHRLEELLPELPEQTVIQALMKV